MKNFVGVILIVVGLGLILTEGESEQYVEEYEQNDLEDNIDPEQVDPGDGTTMKLQPILGIMLILSGAGVLVYAYNEDKPAE